jgi:hypothetical protein
MKLRATIVIDVEASDFAEAADHQRRIEQALKGIREKYGAASLDFREQRARRASDGELRPRRQPLRPGEAPEGLRPYLD